MKRLLLIIGGTLALAIGANANIIPTGNITIGTGPYTWTYQLQLSADQNVNAGTAPSSNPVPHTNLSFGGFITIYDFAGYVGGSCTGPAGWTCTAQNVGFTPDDVIPTDSPVLTNLTWTYTSGATILGQPEGVDLSQFGAFSAQSIYNIPTQVSYASRGIANAGPQVGTIADNVGNTQGPSGVPEPMSLFLTGGGLISVVWLARRRKNA